MTPDSRAHFDRLVRGHPAIELFVIGEFPLLRVHDGYDWRLRCNGGRSLPASGDTQQEQLPRTNKLQWQFANASCASLQIVRSPAKRAAHIALIVSAF